VYKHTSTSHIPWLQLHSGHCGPSRLSANFSTSWVHLSCGICACAWSMRPCMPSQMCREWRPRRPPAIDMCDMTRSYVWQNIELVLGRCVFVCLCKCGGNGARGDHLPLAHWCVRPDSFMCVTWLIHMCDLSNSYVRHDSFIWVTWLVHVCDMTHSYVWHGL